MRRHPNSPPGMKVPWGCVSTFGLINGITVCILLIAGLATQTVLEGHVTHLGVPYRIEVTYYGAKSAGRISWHTERIDHHSLDAATCGKASSVGVAGAFHYLAVFASLPMIFYFWLDRQPDTMESPLTHLALLSLCTLNGFLIAINVALMDAHRKVCLDTFSQQPIGVQYQMGPCWYTVMFSQGLLCITFIVYVFVRFCRPCCSRRRSAENNAVAVPQALGEQHETLLNPLNRPLEGHAVLVIPAMPEVAPAGS